MAKSRDEAGRGVPKSARQVIIHDNWRQKLKAGAIVNRLYKCAMGEIEMNANQIKAAIAVLNKLVPDLKSIEIVGDEERPVVTEIRRVLVDPKAGTAIIEGVKGVLIDERA